MGESHAGRLAFRARTAPRRVGLSRPMLGNSGPFLDLGNTAVRLKPVFSWGCSAGAVRGFRVVPAVELCSSGSWPAEQPAVIKGAQLRSVPRSGQGDTASEPGRQ